MQRSDGSRRLQGVVAFVLSFVLSFVLAGCLAPPPEDHSGDASSAPSDATMDFDTTTPADDASDAGPVDDGADAADASDDVTDASPESSACGPDNCPTGCCDSNGLCALGTSAAACGKGGVQCATCATGQACDNQACSCGGSGCTGCCDDAGSCQTSKNTTCGATAAACVACAQGQECGPNGSCVCDATSCPMGCCQGATCVPYGSQSATKCGTGGATCSTCSLANAAANCSNGGCGIASCSSGFGNCDNVTSNGCETNVNTSTTYCGACGSGRTCPTGGTCNSGTCACPSGQTNCGGTCTNTQGTDAANCGSCGHGCLGGGCSGGVCQRWTLANASVTSNPIYLAADATNVYWADDGLDAVLQVPVTQAGATPVTLSKNASFVNLQGIAVNGSTVAFTSNDNAILTTASLWKATVGVMNQALSPLDTFAGGSNPGTISFPAFSSDGTTIYISFDPEDSLGNHTTNTILYACPTGTANACSSLTSIASHEVSGPVISGSFIFLSDFGGATLNRYTIPSGPLTTSWIASEPNISAWAGDSSHVFFTYNGDGTGSTIAPASAVASAANGSVQPLGYTNPKVRATSMTSDGKFAYIAWINDANGTGAIQYTPVGGGTVQTLYTGTQPWSVTAANGGIYWIDGSNIYGQRFP